MGKKASERTITYASAGSPVKKGRVKSTSILEFGFIINAISGTVWNRDAKPSAVYADLTFAGKDSVSSAPQNLPYNRGKLRLLTESCYLLNCPDNDCLLWARLRMEPLQRDPLAGRAETLKGTSSPQLSTTRRWSVWWSEFHCAIRTRLFGVQFLCAF